jgi:FkbM family methyltransferase
MTLSDTKAREETSDPAAAASFTSYSLNCEDVILNRLFPQQRHGFYVDVGAGHPRFENDLYAFYERGWNGINVEPNEAFFALHEQMRPRDHNLCMVLSDTAGEPLAYYEVEGSGLSTCDEAQAKDHAAHGQSLRARTVPVGTLAGILTEAGTRQIDVLKVDVEGFEERVLSGNDWERFRPSVVLVEATYPESRERRPTNIRGFMEQRGYRHVHFDGLNDFYLEQSFSEPDGLTLPPNVFDHYVPREIADLRDQVVSLCSNFKSAENYAHSLQATCGDLQNRYDEARRAYDNALKIAESLAGENRRLGQQVSNLTNENRRWRNAADQMRAEIAVLNRLLEPLHVVTEQMDHVRRRHENEMHLLRTEMARQNSEMQAERQRQDAELREMHARLRNVYASRSWLLTRPWRVTGRVLRRLGGSFRSATEPAGER